MDPTFSESWWVKSGEETQLTLRFNTDVDVDSANHTFKKIFGEHSWSAEWNNQREVVLKMKLSPDKSPHPVSFNLSGILDMKGYSLVDHHPIQIYNHTGFAYGTLDAESLQTTELYRTTQQFYSFHPSDDGKFALAQVSQSDESGPSVFVLLDLRRGGESVHVFKPNEIHYPQWVKGGGSFVYATHHAEQNAIKEYSILSKQSETLWVLSIENEGLHWLRPYSIPGKDKLWILDYRSITPNYAFTYLADLSMMKDSNDDNPIKIADFQRGVCEGAICHYPFKPLSENVVYYEQMIANESDAPFVEHILYDTSTYAIAKLELDPEIENTLQSVTALDDRRILIVHENRKREPLMYSFTVYYPWENRHEFLLETKEWTGYSSFGQSVPLGKERFLIGTGEKGVIIDLKRNTLERVDYQPVYHTSGQIYWGKRLE